MTAEQVHQFCLEVGSVIERKYGYFDGADFCFSSIETGAVNPEHGVAAAAAQCAQQLAQP